MEKAKITWLGHASVLVEFGGKAIYFDPWLDDNPACSMKKKDVKKATVVCATHGHIDHIGDSFEIVRKTGAKLICTPELGFYADSKGLKEGKEVYGLNTGGSWKSDGFRITMVPAAHTSEIMGEGWVSGPIQPGSGAIGFVLDIEGGPTIVLFRRHGCLRRHDPHQGPIPPEGGDYDRGRKVQSPVPSTLALARSRSRAGTRW